MDSENFLQSIELETSSATLERPKKLVNFTPFTKKHAKSNKSSSIKSKKSGYRPILVDKESLEFEAVELKDKMTMIRELYSTRCLSDQDLVVLYLVIYLNTRYPYDFLENYNPILISNEKTDLITKSGKLDNFITLTNKSFDDKLAKYNTKSLFEIINCFNLHSVPHSARIALTNWYLLNQFRINLMIDVIPSSQKVLALQAEASRCACLITLKLDELVLEERDPLSFLLHDLVHAFKMFSDIKLLEGQCGFSKAMMRILNNPKGGQKIQQLCATDLEFQEAFNYLISDMNSHPKHLFHYFKAILVNYYKKKYDLTNEILSGESLQEFEVTFEEFLDIFQMNEAQKEIARKILMPVNNVRVKGSNYIDFNLLNDYFINLFANKRV